MFLSAGQTSDYTGAAALVRSLPQAGVLLADRGYDANWFRNALTDMGIQPCIPSRKNRKVPIEHDADLYKKRHKIENTFARNQRLAQSRHPLRPMRRPLPLSLRPCRYRHVLAMSPDPRTGCNGQRPLVGRFQCLRPRRFGQAHSAEAEAEALFWVDAVAQDHLDQRRDIWPDLPGPSLQPLRGPIWMTTVTGLNPGSPGDCCPNRRGHGGRRAPGCRLCRTWRERTHRSARAKLEFG